MSASARCVILGPAHLLDDNCLFRLVDVNSGKKERGEGGIDGADAVCFIEEPFVEEKRSSCGSPRSVWENRRRALLMLQGEGIPYVVRARDRLVKLVNGTHRRVDGRMRSPQFNHGHHRRHMYHHV